jgi:type II secretory pathway component PulM
VAALRASPLAVFGAVAVIILPILRTTSLAGRWQQLPAKTRSILATIGIVAALAASEVWQLGRFGLL